MRTGGCLEQLTTISLRRMAPGSLTGFIFTMTPTQMFVSSYPFLIFSHFHMLFHQATTYK